MMKSMYMMSAAALLLVGLMGCGGAEPAKAGDETTEMKPLTEQPPAANNPEPAEPADPLAAPSDVAQAPPNAEFTPSGLATRVLRAGTGMQHPGSASWVKVHYTGWTTDGNMFDSSVARGKPIAFPLDKVIPGWREGVRLMVAGEKRRMWIPASLAYEGKPGRPQGVLVFDVELIELLDGPPDEGM
jgi:FKBP-type peptidyl-prolyl cis-trans isomerase